MAEEEGKAIEWPGGADEATDFDYLMVGKNNKPIMKIPKEKLNEVIVINGEGVKAVAGGATSSIPTILRPGPAGSNRKMEDVTGWFVNGTSAEPPVATGTAWEAPAGKKNTNWWDGTAKVWSLGSSLPLPANTLNAPDWVAGSYKKNDIVTNSNKQWVALENTSQIPSDTASQWKRVDESSKSFTTEKNTFPLSATIVNGFLTRAGTSNNNSSFKRTATSNVNMFNVSDNKAYEYDGEIDLAVYSTMAGVLYLDSSFGLLGYDASETRVFKNYGLNLPVGTRYIAACAKGKAPIIREVDVKMVLKSIALPKEARGQVTITVDPDAELSENVFHNLSDAITRYKEFDSAIIRIKGGTYRETVNLDTIGDLRIESMDNNQVFVSGGEILSGWTKTAGYDNVYQISYSKAIPQTTQDSRKRIFEHGRESVEIPAEKYHPLQKGLKKVMPYTEITEVTTITLCNSTPGTFFYSGGILYIHTNDSVNPNTSGFSYENAVRPNTTWGTTRTGRKVELNNITFLYSSNDGCHIYGRHVIRHNVCVFGSASEGINDDNCTGYSFGDEVGGAGADAINGHNLNYNLIDIRYRQYAFYYFNVYVHDSDGDCISHHERSMIFIQNILGERCKRRGAIPFGGSAMTIQTGRFRDNLMEGCMAQNNADDNNSGKVTTFLHLINVVCENHTVNFRTTEGATIIAEWTRSKGATVNDVDNAGIFEYHDFGVDIVGPNNIVGAGIVRKTQYTLI